MATTANNAVNGRLILRVSIICRLSNETFSPLSWMSLDFETMASYSSPEAGLIPLKHLLAGKFLPTQIAITPIMRDDNSISIPLEKNPCELLGTPMSWRGYRLF
jgi:hypothetical protein